jgi:hypothetical protein
MKINVKAVEVDEGGYTGIVECGFSDNSGFVVNTAADAAVVGYQPSCFPVSTSKVFPSLLFV